MLQKKENQKWQLFLIVSLFIIGWISLYPVFSQTIGELSPQDVNAIIPEIETAEKSIHNLKVDAESWLEERASLSNPWQRTPIYFSCTALIDGNPKNKIRVDVHKKKSKWIDGAAPYLENSYSVSFDGANTKSIENTTSHSGKTWPENEGQISPGLSQQMKHIITSKCTGWGLTTNSFFNDEEESMSSFSQMFRVLISPEALAAKSNVQFDFVYEQKDGVLCLKVGTKPAKWGGMAWWFDPNRGFALMAYLHTNKGTDGIEHIVSDIRVNKLKEVAKGVWWPMEATMETEIRDPMLCDPNGPYKIAPYQRTVYRALDVVVNDSKFDETIFEITFPEGYRIDDKVAGKTYVVDANNKID